MANPLSYQSTYRRSEIAIPMLIGVLILFGAGMTLILLYLPTRNFEGSLLSFAGITVGMLLYILLSTFRRHRWTLQPQGMEIEEGPRVPLMGRKRRTFVPFADIVALRDVQSGFDVLIEIVTRRGARHRLSQALVQEKGQRLGQPDPNAPLSGFAQAIRDAAAKSGVCPPAPAQGLSFWNTGPGIGFQAFLLILALAISGVVVFALVHGFTVRQARGGEAMAIMLLLPVGAFWLLRKSLRRRREVLESLRQNSPVRR
jgi:hypothetical protein